MGPTECLLDLASFLTDYPVLDIPPHRSVSFDFHFTGAGRGDGEIDFIYPIPLITGFATIKVARSVKVN